MIGKEAMKNLFLMRHAESPNSIMNDFDRVLTPAGIEKSKEVGKILANYKLDRIFSSDSTRTKQTVEGIVSSLNSAPIIKYHHSLYHITVENLLAFIQDSLIEYDNILIVNHNPVISQLIAFLLQKDKDSPAYDVVIRGLPPASLFHFEDNKLANFWL